MIYLVEPLCYVKDVIGVFYKMTAESKSLPRSKIEDLLQKYQNVYIAPPNELDDIGHRMVLHFVEDLRRILGLDPDEFYHEYCRKHFKIK